METNEMRLASSASTITIFSRMLSIKLHGLRRFQSKSRMGPDRDIVPGGNQNSRCESRFAHRTLLQPSTQRICHRASPGKIAQSWRPNLDKQSSGKLGRLFRNQLFWAHDGVRRM